MIVKVDSLGRIVIRRKLRDKYGDKFILVDRQNEIVLKPFEKDMSDLGEKLEKYSLAQLKKIAEEEGEKEATGNLK